ncbi:MAG: hypothetical protein WCE80_15180 [Acidimicrobiia bacterium]
MCLLVVALVALLATSALAQTLLDDSATTSTQGLFKTGVTLVVAPRVSDDESIEMELRPMFDGVTQAQAEEAAQSSGFSLYSVGLGRYDLEEMVSGPSVLGTPGVFVSDDYAWVGVEAPNDLQTREIRTAIVATSSLKLGCLGKHREVNLAMARPGLPVYASSDDFTGNPMIGNNVMLTLAVDDCMVQAYYFESVGGELGSYQTRGSIEYWDDGQQAVIAFHGAPPTFEGEATVSVVESPLPAVSEETFAYFVRSLNWRDLNPIPLQLGTPQPFSAVSPMPPNIPGMFPEMPASTTTTESSTTSQSSGSTTTTRSSASDEPSSATSEKDDGNGILLPAGLGMVTIVALIVGWLLWTWCLRRGAYPKEEPIAEDDPFGVLGVGGVDTQPRPITVSFARFGLHGDDEERVDRLQAIVDTFRGTGDIAGVAEALFEFDQWHKEAFGGAWFTWSNDSGPGTLVGAVTTDEFLMCNEMSCFEFVHLCAYIASDQLGRPRFDDDGNQLDGLQPHWGIVPWVQDPATLGGDVERGSILTGRSYWGSNQAGYYHVAIAIGDDDVISLRNGGLSKQGTWGWWGACFSPAVYYYLDVGEYKYSSTNPAPQNPK